MVDSNAYRHLERQLTTLSKAPGQTTTKAGGIPILLMQCPNCGNPKTHKHGDRRRRCPACGKTFTIDKRSDGGRPAIGDKPLTGYEKIKRYRAKRKKSN